MKHIGLFCCLSCLLLGCEKNEEKAALYATCVEAKYVGTGCWDVIQILRPAEFSWTGSWYYSEDTTYQNCVGVSNLLDHYKNGQPFYFTVSTIDSSFLLTTDCTLPKYSIIINNYTDRSCNPVTPHD